METRWMHAVEQRDSIESNNSRPWFTWKVFCCIIAINIFYFVNNNDCGGGGDGDDDDGGGGNSLSWIANLLSESETAHICVSALFQVSTASSSSVRSRSRSSMALCAVRSTNVKLFFFFAAESLGLSFFLSVARSHFHTVCNNSARVLLLRLLLCRGYYTLNAMSIAIVCYFMDSSTARPEWMSSQLVIQLEKYVREQIS